MSQRMPDYEDLRARQARAQQADRISHEAQHVREVPAVHEGYGEEAWCPNCREYWPCEASKGGRARA